MHIHATALTGFVTDAARSAAARGRLGRGLAKVAGKAGFLGDVWRLAKPYWRSEERVRAWTLLTLLLAAKMSLIYVCLAQNAWYADFYQALQSRQWGAFLAQVERFGLIAGAFILLTVGSHLVAENLKLSWRDWLVRRTLHDWLSERAYHRIETETRETTNPDQRIVADLGLFAGQTLDLAVGFLDVSVSLIAFTGVLWGLSGTIEVAGFQIAGYMVFAVFGYAIASTWITHRIGRSLIGLHRANQTLEGEFRYGLMRLRENAETVAFYGGERQEERVLRQRWAGLVANFGGIVRREQCMGIFTVGYGQASIILPFLLCAPRYFSEGMNFAQVMQVAAAFASVQAGLGFFIHSYGQIAHWRATTDRLKAFRDDLDDCLAARRSDFEVERRGKGLQVQDLTLRLPNQNTLIAGVTLEAGPGEALLVKGPSGTGKSTLLRAIAGLWQHGSGQVRLSEGDVFFLPQRPYLPLGTLRDAVLYPTNAEAAPGAVEEALRAVRLGHLIPHLDEVAPWASRLSGGEQQRIAFARVLVAKPATVFLDEATSALDEATEAHVYQTLRQAPFRPTLVSIGHRSTLHAHHDRTVELKRAA